MKKVATSHSRRTTRLLALGTSLAVAIGLTATAAVAAPPTPPPSNNSPGSVPPWAGSRAKTGTPLSNTTVEGEIYLNLPDAGAAKAFATAVSTPGNPNYQQYLSPADWIAKYGPAITKHRQMRSAVLAFAVVAFVATGVAGAFGAFLNKYAPVRGGPTTPRCWSCSPPTRASATGPPG